MTDHDITIGDSAKLLLTLDDDSVDVIITDPPYSDHTHSKQRRGATGYEEQRSGASRARISRTRDLGFDAITATQRVHCAVQFARIAKRWTLLFTDDRGIHAWTQALIDAGLEWIRTPVWEKLGSTPQFTGDRPAQGVEFMLLFHRPGRKVWNGGGKVGTYRHAIVLNRHGEERFHTTQKPLPLMVDLVRDFSNYGETILDPFAGSGTTAVAAKMWGRNSINFEIDANYAATALDRVAGAVEDTRASWKNRREIKQDGLIGDGFKAVRDLVRCSFCGTPTPVASMITGADGAQHCVCCDDMIQRGRLKDV